jgi:hypothetical protein
MTLRSYILEQHPDWDIYIDAQREVYFPKLRKEYESICSGPIGRAKVRYMKETGMRVRSAANCFDAAIECLRKEGAI